MPDEAAKIFAEKKREVHAKAYIEGLASDVAVYKDFRAGLAGKLEKFRNAVEKAKNDRNDAESAAAQQLYRSSMRLEHGESPKKTDPAKDAQFAAETRARADAFFKEHCQHAPDEIVELCVIDFAGSAIKKKAMTLALSCASHWSSVKLIGHPRVPTNRAKRVRTGRADDGDCDEEDEPMENEEEEENGETLPSVPAQGTIMQSKMQKLGSLSKDTRQFRKELEADALHYDAPFTVMFSEDSCRAKARHFSVLVPKASASTGGEKSAWQWLESSILLDGGLILSDASPQSYVRCSPSLSLA